MRKIAVANQKGGCGKTTTAMNTAAALAMLGKRVLILDLDPQAHTTLGFGQDPEALGKTVYDCLVNAQIPLSKIIVDTRITGLRMAPTNILLSGAEFEMASLSGREFVLSQRLQPLEDGFDICVIDCSPSLSLLTLNALVASDEVLIPVQTHYYALEGLKQLLETIEIVKSRFNSNLRILGVLLTFVEKRTMLSKQVQEQMRSYFGDLVFDAVIHRTVKLAEAPSAGEPVLTYAPASQAAAEYLNLAREITNGSK